MSFLPRRNYWRRYDHESRHHHPSRCRGLRGHSHFHTIRRRLVGCRELTQSMKATIPINRIFRQNRLPQRFHPAAMMRSYKACESALRREAAAREMRLHEQLRKQSNRVAELEGILDKKVASYRPHVSWDFDVRREYPATRGATLSGEAAFVSRININALRFRSPADAE